MALDELDQRAADLGAVGSVAMAESAHSYLTLARRGDLREYAAATERITAAFGRTGGIWVHVGALRAAECRYLEGFWSEAADIAHRTAGAFDQVQWRGADWAHEIRTRARVDPAAARASFEDHRRYLPAPGASALVGQRYFATVVVEPLVVVGLLDDAAALYDVVCDGIRHGFLVHPSGLSECSAGTAAGAGGHWDRAEGHFATALRQAHTLPHRIMQPEVRRWHAWMLHRRDAPGDRERARTLLTEALAMYREIGMVGHVGLAEAALTGLEA